MYSCISLSCYDYFGFGSWTGARGRGRGSGRGMYEVVGVSRYWNIKQQQEPNHGHVPETADRRPEPAAFALLQEMKYDPIPSEDASNRLVLPLASPNFINAYFTFTLTYFRVRAQKTEKNYQKKEN